MDGFRMFLYLQLCILGKIVFRVPCLCSNEFNFKDFVEYNSGLHLSGLHFQNETPYTL